MEELLRFGDDGSGNEKEVRKIISQYLRDPRHVNRAHSTLSGMCAAIKSYFDAHDVATNVKFNGKKTRSKSPKNPSWRLPTFTR